MKLETKFWSPVPFGDSATSTSAQNNPQTHLTVTSAFRRFGNFNPETRLKIERLAEVTSAFRRFGNFNWPFVTGSYVFSKALICERLHQVQTLMAFRNENSLEAVEAQAASAHAGFVNLWAARTIQRCHRW